MWNARNLVRTSLAPFVYIFLTVQLDTNEKIVLGKFETFRFPLYMSSFVPLSACFFWFQQKILAYIHPIIGTPVAVE